MNSNKSLSTKEIFDLALQNYKNNNLVKAISLYEKVLDINPKNVDAQYSIGNIFYKLGQYQKALNSYKKVVQIDTRHAKSHYNTGVILHELGQYQKALNSYKKVVQIDPRHVRAQNNLGIVFDELLETEKAINCYKKAIKLNPNYIDPYWNLHSLAPNIEEALKILKKLHKINNNFFEAEIMIAALKGFKNDFKDYNLLIESKSSNHSMIRSVKWVFSLPKLPKIFFNRWDFFDFVATLTNKSRPFYEFGVWKGVSFKYLLNIFKKGFGFDTFTGLPNDWYDKSSGSYSSFGEIPNLKGGKFIVGKFEDTLPKFFSKKRPIASILNFDADLYSSTLCALNNTDKIIDNKSILIFDEFLINKNWEQDEYRALNEFCNNFDYRYEVLAVSFYSKQVAVRLNK